MVEGSRLPQGRCLIKLSGEALGGASGSGVDVSAFEFIALELIKALKVGNAFSVVVGGGNFFRGAGSLPWAGQRVVADQAGMLGTVMNGLLLRDCLVAHGVDASVSCAFGIDGVLPAFSAERSRRDLDDGKIVVLSGGTGNPFFTTDTTACLRALELDADTVMKATRVNGVYDRDPEQYSDAVRYDRLSFDQAISEDLKIVDTTALTLCREHNLRLRVLDLGIENNLSQAMTDLTIGTLVEN
jgi:uridylate kinase